MPQSHKDFTKTQQQAISTLLTTEQGRLIYGEAVRTYQDRPQGFTIEELCARPSFRFHGEAFQHFLENAAELTALVVAALPEGAVMVVSDGKIKPNPDLTGYVLSSSQAARDPELKARMAAAAAKAGQVLQIVPDTPSDFRLTREQARDLALYQRTKEAAAKVGQTVSVVG